MSKNSGERLLFDLIHSLTKSEKRSFKLYVNKSGDVGGAKYMKIFDIMEKLKDYDEDLILKKLSGMTKPQFSNQKAHLYGLVLASLRVNSLKQDIDIHLREQLDYIRVLYKKGLYDQSLRLLTRAKNITGDYRKDLFQIAILDYEKQIRSQQVFDLEEEYIDQLDREYRLSMKRFDNVQQFFTLAIKMKARFIERGMAKSDTEINNLKALFYTQLPDYEESKLAFNEKFYLYRAFYWFSYLTYDFPSCIIYAEKWVNIFEETGLDQKRRAGYLKGMNRLLQSTFRVNAKTQFCKYYEHFLNFEKSQFGSMASNTQMLLLKYKAIQTFNMVFLTAEFEQHRPMIEAMLSEIEANEEVFDKHNRTVIYYKAGVYFFALEDYEKSNFYFNKLIQDGDKIRSDLKGFARIISLIMDYEMANEGNLDRKLKSAYGYLNQQQNLGEFQTAILDFIQDLGKFYPQEIKKGFKSLKARLEELEKDRFAKKTLLYFDIISWLDAKIADKSFAEIVREKVAGYS
jgi:hypothetical protein